MSTSSAKANEIFFKGKAVSQNIQEPSQKTRVVFLKDLVHQTEGVSFDSRHNWIVCQSFILGSSQEQQLKTSCTLTVHNPTENNTSVCTEDRVLKRHSSPEFY